MFARNTVRVSDDPTSPTLQHLLCLEPIHSLPLEDKVAVAKDVRLLTSQAWTVYLQDTKTCVLRGQDADSNLFVIYYEETYIIKEEKLDPEKLGGWINTFYECEYTSSNDAIPAVLSMVANMRKEDETIRTIENHLDDSNKMNLTLNNGTTFYIVRN